MKTDIKFRSKSDGSDWHVSKTFNSERHRDNYIAKICTDLGMFLDEIWFCDTCNGRGWIDTYNTSTNTQEIQRCDGCKAFGSDDEAREFVNNKNK